MDLNCPNIKLEPSPVANHHHRTSNDWSTDDGDGFDCIDMENSHTTPPTTTSSTSNNVDILDYPNCVPVTPNSLDSSNGLNGSCSAVNLNGTNGYHQKQQSIHTFEVNDQPLHPQQQLAYLSSSSSQSVTPIDMKNQDRIKLERKRLRNRLAASKCRKRKIEKINKLEEKVKQVRPENNELQLTIQKYRMQLITIKKELMQHAEHGCSIPLPLPYPT